MSQYPHNADPHYVYRCYAADGRLLYVGVSYQPRERMAQHEKRAAWFGQVASVRYVVFPNRAYALAKEREAIRNEHPIHNQAHKRVWTSADETARIIADYQAETALTGIRKRKADALDALVKARSAS